MWTADKDVSMKAIFATTWTSVKKNIWFSYIHGYLFIISWVHLEPTSDQLPIGLLAQLVEHYTSVTEVMGSNPVQAWTFFQALFSLLLK